MPVQDDFIDMGKHDKRKQSNGDLVMPLWRNGWRAERSRSFRKCISSGETIWPFQLAYVRDTFWGLSNAKTHTEVETEWLSPASYTYEKLKA